MYAFFEFTWDPTYGVSDNDKAIKQLYREFFELPLIWRHCFAHVIKQFSKRYAKLSNPDCPDSLGDMETDLGSFHFAHNDCHADILKMLFQEKHNKTSPKVVAAFGNENFTKENFNWVSTVDRAGVAKTNNGCENFNRQIANILLEWKVPPLEVLLNDIPEYVRKVSCDFSSRKWPESSTDVLVEGATQTRGNVRQGICQRVRKYWQKAQAISTAPQSEKFQFKVSDGSKIYFLNSRTKKAIIRNLASHPRSGPGGLRRDRTADMQYYRELLERCVLEYIDITMDLPRNCTERDVTAAACESIKLLAYETDDLEQLMSCPFDRYVFILKLFWVYDTEQGTCTCRVFTHYRVCKHKIAMQLQEKEIQPPAIWDTTPIKVISKKRMRQKPKDSTNIPKKTNNTSE